MIDHNLIWTIKIKKHKYVSIQIFILIRKILRTGIKNVFGLIIGLYDTVTKKGSKKYKHLKYF